MPIFDMKCPKCKKVFEDVYIENPSVIIMCPTCKKVRLTKLPPRVGIIFKGSGWTK